MENTEQINGGNKVQIGAKVDPLVANVIEEMAKEEDRSNSNMTERLLKESPRLAERLELATA